MNYLIKQHLNKISGVLDLNMSIKKTSFENFACESITMINLGLPVLLHLLSHLKPKKALINCSQT